MNILDSLWLWRLRESVRRNELSLKEAREWREYWTKQAVIQEAELLAAKRKLERAEIHAGFRLEINRTYQQ